MPRLPKGRSTGPQPDYHPPVVDEFVDADGERMVELLDGNIEPAEAWETLPIPRHEEHIHLDDEYTPPRPDYPQIDRSRKPIRHIDGTKNTVLYVSSFCTAEQRLTGALAEQTGTVDTARGDRCHTQCKGGFLSGAGVVTICGCPGHDGENRCLVCTQAVDPDAYDRDFRVCTDVEACADALHQQAIEASQTPVSRMIREVTAESRRGSAVGGSTPRQVAGENRPERRQGRPCQCGCGLMTGGGLFRPGHDARLKSALKKAVEAGDHDAYLELVVRGWPTPAGVEISVPPGVVANEDSKQSYIATRVAARYENAEAQE